MKKKQRSTKGIIILIFFILLIIGNTVLSSFYDHTITATVVKKDTVVNYSKKSRKTKYFIYCVDADGNEYKLKDTNILIRGKMNSRKIYFDLEEGKTYHFTVVGYKIPVIVPYENILTYEEVNNNHL